MKWTMEVFIMAAMDIVGVSLAIATIITTGLFVLLAKAGSKKRNL